MSPDSGVGHPHSESDLIHFSSSSHHNGVLETFLDVITTTININDANPEAQHLIDDSSADSSLSQNCSTPISHISHHKGSHIDVSIKIISVSSPTDITDVVEKEKTILASHHQASSSSSHLNPTGI